MDYSGLHTARNAAQAPGRFPALLSDNVRRMAKTNPPIKGIPERPRAIPPPIDEPTSDMSKSHKSLHKSPRCEPSAAEEGHRAEERRVWGRQIRIARWLNCITAGGVIAAAIGLAFIYVTLGETKRAGDEAKRAADIAHDALLESNRAWLAPVDAVLDGQIQKSSKSKF